MLQGKKILIGVSGSIAAYKIPLLIRLLVKEGAEVQVILTPNARDFVTPLTISTLSKRPALTFPFDQKDGTWNSHVDMGNWADLMLVAPASAATLAKMASGLADNLLTTTYLSAKCPVFFAPAMDLDMYKHQATLRNVKTLVEMGNHLVEPQVGELASGLSGAGRMEEPEAILEVIKGHFSKEKQFGGKHFLITAGPTFEDIDPVRFIGNYSSGRMGFALAQEAAQRGATVTLVSGPVSLGIEHPAINRVDVISAAQMHQVVMDAFPDAAVTIMAAAVADFAPAEKAPVKIKKSHELPVIRLKPTIDILAAMGQKKTASQVLVGFALETNDELANARKKLENKNLDFIVLNSLRDEGAGFGSVTNKITILRKDGNKTDFALKSKAEVAGDILDHISEMIK